MYFLRPVSTRIAIPLSEKSNDQLYQLWTNTVHIIPVVLSFVIKLVIVVKF